jgi:hypothetical protein
MTLLLPGIGRGEIVGKCTAGSGHRLAPIIMMERPLGSRDRARGDRHVEHRRAAGAEITSSVLMDNAAVNLTSDIGGSFPVGPSTMTFDPTNDAITIDGTSFCGPGVTSEFLRGLTAFKPLPPRTSMANRTPSYRRTFSSLPA